MANSFWARTYTDYSAEKSNVRLRVEEMTSATIVANLVALAALNAAVDDLSIGQPQKNTIIQDDSVISNLPATDVNAQRERKWLVSYRDTVTEELFQFEIPAAKLTGNLTPNTDQADLTSADWVAFIAAFEAIVLSPNGNAVTVEKARHVGRKL